MNWFRNSSRSLVSTLRLLVKPMFWVNLYPAHHDRGIECSPIGTVTRDCEVEGVIPEAMRGKFMRITPRSTPRIPWPDSRSTAHVVHIKPDQVTFFEQHVRTTTLAMDEKESYPVYETFGQMGSMGAMLRELNYTVKNTVGYLPGELQSRTNTSLVYDEDQVRALLERGLPYAVRAMCDGAIETIGQMMFDSNLKVPFSAHPKTDPATGKLYGIGYQLDGKPHLTFFVLDVEGNIERQFPLPLDRPVMMHDFSITETHAVFLDLPLVMDPSIILSGNLPIVFKKEAGARRVEQTRFASVLGPTSVFLVPLTSVLTLADERKADHGTVLLA